MNHTAPRLLEVASVQIFMAMKRSFFLLISGIILLSIGIFYNLAPEEMLSGSLYEVDKWTLSFARTSGIFIGSFGLLSLLARNSDDSVALRAILLAMPAMLLLTTALDIWFKAMEAPVKNTASVMLRIVLAAGYLYFWSKTKRSQ